MIDHSRAARRNLADKMAAHRRRGENGRMVLTVGRDFAAAMSVRHLSSGHQEWAEAYANVWRYLEDSLLRYAARRVR